MGALCAGGLGLCLGIAQIPKPAWATANHGPASQGVLGPGSTPVPWPGSFPLLTGSGAVLRTTGPHPATAALHGAMSLVLLVISTRGICEG